MEKEKCRGCTFFAICHTKEGFLKFARSVITDRKYPGTVGEFTDNEIEEIKELSARVLDGMHRSLGKRSFAQRMHDKYARMIEKGGESE